jgi:hypothetical protein
MAFASIYLTNTTNNTNISHSEWILQNERYQIHGRQISALKLIAAVFTAHKSVDLPATECLMVKELIPGGLHGIQSVVAYGDYQPK